MSYQQGRGRFSPATLTVFNHRICAMKGAEPHAWQGFNVVTAILSDGEIRPAVVLGPVKDDMSLERKSRAIPLSTVPGKMPKIVARDEGRVLHGSFEEEENGDLVLVGTKKEGYITRIFRTGLLVPMGAKNARQARAHRKNDLLRLASEGVKIEYHGIFPLETGSAFVRAGGETVEVMEIANVFDLSDPNGRTFRNLNVAESREMGAEIPRDGAVICGDLGKLSIHEVTASGEQRIWDVTNDPKMWQRFRRYAAAQLEQDAQHAHSHAQATA